MAVLGNELSHITDFKGRGFLELALWAMRYLFVKRRAKIERATDMDTIEHGLGWQLYAWAEYFVNESHPNKHYRKMREKKYLRPDKILAYMKSHHLK